MVAHTFNPCRWEGSTGRSLEFEAHLFTDQVPGQLGLHRETLLWKKKKSLMPCTLLILLILAALRRQRELGLYRFETSLVNRMSSRIARAKQGCPVSKTPPPPPQRKNKTTNQTNKNSSERRAGCLNSCPHSYGKHFCHFTISSVPVLASYATESSNNGF